MREVERSERRRACERCGKVDALDTRREMRRRDAMDSRDRMDRDRLDRDRRGMSGDMRGNRPRVDTVYIDRDSSEGGRTRMVRTQTPGGQWITIPVPVQGEVILRYGMPPRGENMGPAGRMQMVPMGPMRRDTIVMRVDSMGVRRDSVVVSGNAASPDLAAELRELERRLNARIDASRTAPAPAAPNVTTIVPGVAAPTTAPAVAPTTETVVIDRNSRPACQRLQQVRSSDLRPYVGLGLDDGDMQFVAGLRADLGPLNPSSGWHFVPELAIGVGEGNTSVLAMANAQFAFGALGGSNAVRPYVTLGAGVFSPTVLGVNTALGASFAVNGAGSKPLYMNVELQGINIFRQTRILVGLSRSR